MNMREVPAVEWAVAPSTQPVISPLASGQKRAVGTVSSKTTAASGAV